MRGWESVRTWDWVKGDIYGTPVRWQTNGRDASYNHRVLDRVLEYMSLMASRVKWSRFRCDDEPSELASFVPWIVISISEVHNRLFTKLPTLEETRHVGPLKTALPTDRRCQSMTMRPR